MRLTKAQLRKYKKLNAKSTGTGYFGLILLEKS